MSYLENLIVAHRGSGFVSIISSDTEELLHIDTRDSEVDGMYVASNPCANEFYVGMRGLSAML